MTEKHIQNYLPFYELQNHQNSAHPKMATIFEFI